MAVSAGLTAPMLGKKLVSTTYRCRPLCFAVDIEDRTRRIGAEPAGAGLVGDVGHVLFIPGIVVLALGLILEAGATGAVKAIKMSAKLVAGRKLVT